MDSAALVVWLTGSSAPPHLKTLHRESAPPSFEGTRTLGAHSLSSPPFMSWWACMRQCIHCWMRRAQAFGRSQWQSAQSDQVAWIRGQDMQAILVCPVPLASRRR
jgi:hypothetical protein